MNPFSQRPMRRKARALSPVECLELLRRGEWGVLALTADGMPYAVPLNYALLKPNETDDDISKNEDAGWPNGWGIVFHCALDGLKLDVLTRNPHACFTVVPTAEVNPMSLSTCYESVIVYGTVHHLAGEERTEALQALALRYSSAYPEERERTLRESGPKTVALRMDIDGITGKFNPRH